MSKKTEKLSERLEIRLGYSEKQTFSAACESQGDTPSGALRRFIKGYVHRANADWQATGWRRLTNRRRYAIGLGGLVAGAALAVTAMLTSERPMSEAPSADMIVAAMEQYEGVWPTAEQVAAFCNGQPTYEPTIDCPLFARYDQDQDGVIRPGEILPNDAPVFHVLDLDRNGITLDEFWAQGRMAYTIADEIEVEMDQNGYPKVTARSSAFGLFRKPKPDIEKRLVEFDLRGDWPKINSFTPDPTLISTRYDRSVFWQRGDKAAASVNSEHDYRARTVSQDSDT